MGFFFSWHRLATQAVDGSHSVELTGADREAEALSQEALHRRTGGRGIALAVFPHKGEDFPAHLDRMPVPSVGERTFPFAPHPLEQPIDCRTMHRDRAVNLRELR